MLEMNPKCQKCDQPIDFMGARWLTVVKAKSPADIGYIHEVCPEAEPRPLVRNQHARLPIW